MSKNDTMKDSLKDTEGYQYIMWNDESFKDIIRFKAVASVIIKALIPEFRHMRFTEVARCIVDTSERKPDRSDSDIMNEEIDMLPSEVGTKDEKNTIHDSVFKMNKPETITMNLRAVDKIITVNIEMQGVTSESQLGYNIVSRAIYYGASLLRGTVPAGDTKYSNIHKVYSIWLCKNNIRLNKLDEVPKELCVHRFSTCRHYESIPGKVERDQKEYDLMEVIMVELSKIMKYSCEECLPELDKETANTLKVLLKEPYNFPSNIEKIERITLPSVREELNMRMSDKEYEKYLDKCAKEDVEGRYLSMIDELQEDIEYNKKKKAKADEAIVNTLIKLTEKKSENEMLDSMKKVAKMLDYDSIYVEKAYQKYLDNLKK